MYQQIQDKIAQGNMEEARVLLDDYKKSAREYDDILAILDATVYGEMGDLSKRDASIAQGLCYNPENFELYYMMGMNFLSDGKINQSYLCFENAVLYCNSEEDLSVIYPIYQEIKASPLLKVKPVSIVIVSYNCSYMMQKNIEAIRDSLYKESYQIVVVDNASDDGIQEWLSEQDDIWLLKNECNVGFGPACNQAVAYCLEHGECENDIFLLNNDTRLAKNALFWMRMGLYSNESVGATGGISNYAGNNQQVEVEFSLPTEYLEYGRKNNVPMNAPYEERIRLSGFAMLIRRGVWNQTGGMDERYAPGYFEDDDLSVRISKLGYRLCVCKNSFIYHAGSQSFSKNPDIENLLMDHYRLFIKTHGFPILEYAYPHKEIVNYISHGQNEPFSVLICGSGLGADLYYVKEHFPHAFVAGIESDINMRACACKNMIVFGSVSELQNWSNQRIAQKIANEPVRFDYVLFIGERASADLDMQITDWKSVLKMSGACIHVREDNICKNYPLMEEIKLVVWDMDDTFWRGTLSEGSVYPVTANNEAVKKMTDAGIMQSISSKNEKEDVFTVLTRMNIADYFVFSDINWENKGPQIADKLKAMGLRAENTLFIDDNVMNIKEVSFYNPSIMTMMPGELPGLYRFANELEATDPSHNRLLQYRIMEQKNRVKKSYSSPEAFLENSDIKVTVIRDCKDQSKRIEELIRRTNQLNYTKIRLSGEQVEELLECASDASEIDAGYITVKDRFTDYGIVGFYALNRAEHRLEHFLFSCRILGMRVEQYVYNLLNRPHIDVQGEVAVPLEPAMDVYWINQDQEKRNNTNRLEAVNIDKCDSAVMAKKVLLKGPCDLGAIGGFLKEISFEEEFNYVDDRGIITTGQNHSVHIRESVELSEEEIQKILLDAPFLSHGDFETSLFEKHYDYVCYSLLPDCHGALYRHKTTGKYMTFGGKNFDLTDSLNWNGYVDGSIVNHAYPFTEAILENVAEKWEFIGTTSLDMIVDNIRWMRKKLPDDTKLILLLGNELEYEGNDMEFSNHAPFHKEVNQKMYELQKELSGIILIDPNEFIHTQEDLEGCTNHFARKVYFEMAMKLEKELI